MSCAVNAAAYLAMSRPWPTLAAACWVARSLGRRVSPSGGRADAIAPEAESPRWGRAGCRAARVAASAAMAAPAISPSGVVREEDPTLTTTRAAPAMSGRAVLVAAAGTSTALVTEGAWGRRRGGRGR